MQRLKKTLVALVLSSSIGCSIPKEKIFIDKISDTASICQIQGEESEECKEAIANLKLFDEKEIPEIDLYSSPARKVSDYFLKIGYFYLNTNNQILLGKIYEKRTVTAHYSNIPYTFDAYLFTTQATSSMTMLNYIGIWRDNKAYFNISAMQYDYILLKKDAEKGDLLAKKALEDVNNSGKDPVDFYLDSFIHHEVAHHFAGDDEYAAYKNQMDNTPSHFMLRVLKSVSHESTPHGEATRKLLEEYNER